MYSPVKVLLVKIRTTLAVEGHSMVMLPCKTWVTPDLDWLTTCETFRIVDRNRDGRLSCDSPFFLPSLSSFTVLCRWSWAGRVLVDCVLDVEVCLWPVSALVRGVSEPAVWFAFFDVGILKWMNEHDEWMNEWMIAQLACNSMCLTY